MKKIFLNLICLTLLITVIGISCGKNNSSVTPNPSGSGANNITIYSMSFSPSSKTVAKGAVVKWTNTDAYQHTVTSNDGSSFDSGTLGSGGVFSYTANTPGTFQYHCTIHGIMMSGTLTVNP